MTVVTATTRAARELSRYAALGLHLVFYPTRQKGPSGVDAIGWTQKSTAPEDYREGDNIGAFTGHEIAPGQFVVDADLDAPETARFIKLLPATRFVFGRKSKPVSHAFYTTPQPIVSMSFNGIDGKPLLELRARKKDGTVGMQTMLPPSVHPSGEVVEFRLDGEIEHVTTETVVVGGRNVSIGAILLRHLGREGFDHNCRLAYAGFLLKAGVTENDAIAIGTVLAEATGNDVRDVEPDVRYTAARIRSGGRVTGAGALAKAIGDNGKAVVSRIREWLAVSSDADADSVDEAEGIDALNERHAIVSFGNKVVVMETWTDGSIKTLWPFPEFQRRHTKEFVKSEGRRRPLADVWLSSPNGRHYDRLVYVMPGSQGQCYSSDYNGWLGFTVTPAPGDWSKNREHVRRIICGGNHTLYAWLFNWMAALVQLPGRHAFTAVVLRGGQGVGKGHFAHLMLGALFHTQQYLHILGSGMLTGRFNEHLSGKVLVFADESTWGGDPHAADKLKGMVTESTIPIERKFLPLVEEPSALHIVIASNNDWPIAIAIDDRRFAVFDVADSERQNDSYFGPLRDELQAGGLPAMLHDLLAHSVDEHALRHPPSTRAKREVTAQSLKPIERWWFEKLQAGCLDVLSGEWMSSVSKEGLHEDLLNFFDKHRLETRNRRATETELGQFLHKYVPNLCEQRSLINGRRERFWNLPTLEVCRAAWLAKCEWPEDYEWDG